MRVQHSGDGVEPVRCTKKSRMSRDYVVEWDDEKAEVGFAKIGDGGSITYNSDKYEIDSRGPLGRVWTLKKGREAVMTAEKHGLRNAIQMECNGEHFSLERKHLLSSEFLLCGNNEVIADFDKPGFFGGKTEIEVMDIETDFLTLAFAFWVVTTIRRTAKGNRKV